MQRPLLQAPFKPPPPPKPEVHVPPSSFADHARQLWMDRGLSDIVLIAGTIGFPAHRFIIAAASPALFRLLTVDLVARSTSDSSMVSSLGDFADDTESLMRSEQKICKRRASFQELPTSRELDHPAFQSVRTVEGQIVITVRPLYK